MVFLEPRNGGMGLLMRDGTACMHLGGRGGFLAFFCGFLVSLFFGPRQLFGYHGNREFWPVVMKCKISFVRFLGFSPCYMY